LTAATPRPATTPSTAWNIGTHRHSPQSVDGAEEEHHAPWLSKIDAAAFEKREAELFEQSLHAIELGDQPIKTESDSASCRRSRSAARTSSFGSRIPR
jgi:hypothetical protein